VSVPTVTKTISVLSSLKYDSAVPPVYPHGPEFETVLKKILYYDFSMFPPIVSVVFENLSHIRRVFQTAFTVKRTITLHVFHCFTVHFSSLCVMVQLIYLYVRNKTRIQMSHIKILKITPKCFDHQLTITWELI
jgi:hypothetical protein